jgi:hypothetical protein
MAKQNKPKYPHVTSIANPVIVNALERKYGTKNVIWPIVLIEGERIIGYLYERNDQNAVNAERDHRPISKAGLPSFFLDYTTMPRRIIPAASFLEPFMAPEYRCSYDYITSSDNSLYSTVDLDYVWANGESWKGMELTTFKVEFVDREKAEKLIRKLHKRPSWQGPEGPHGLRKIVETSGDLGIDLFMACVNTVGGVSNQYKTDGNVYWFPLNLNQINRLVNGELPDNARFDSFSAFLQWL